MIYEADRMEMRFPHLQPGEKPITSVSEYLEARNRCDELDRQVLDLYDEPPRPGKAKILRPLEKKADQVRYELARRTPYVLVSRCPYCNKPVWMGVGIFSLRDEFWYDESGGILDSVYEELSCPHLFCVDGALNLNGHRPADAIKPPMVYASGRITMAAEVPFVKPRVLQLPTMVAVVAHLPIAERYTAYPIAYFAREWSDQVEFCVPWGRIEYVERRWIPIKKRPSNELSQESIADTEQTRRFVVDETFIGTRSDSQCYDLQEWIAAGKVFWLDMKEEEPPLVRGPAEAFPYRDVSGRRHPYYIKKGRVHNLASPKTHRPKYRWEDMR